MIEYNMVMKWFGERVSRKDKAIILTLCQRGLSAAILL